jgi:hypothetical protein
LPRACTNPSPHNPPEPSGQSIVLPVDSWEVERRHDGAVLVRVHSRVANGRALPDAVFAFRAGDPQFSFWEEQLRHREVLNLAPPVVPMPYSTPGA